jgi:ribosomal protein S18 acetylase RimI-like enzyme
MQIHRYRRELARPLMEQAPVYPYVMRTIRFADVPALHALLHEAYAAKGSTLAPCDEWWRVLSTDPEFDPRLVLIVETPIGTLAAAAVAWNTGFVKDLAVAPDHRRLGLASALLGHVFQIFHSRGAHAVDLKVPAHNHAAIALYEAMGLRWVETIEARAA